MDLLPGQSVFVARVRCTLKEAQWPPTRTEERFEATVDRIGPTGMVYLRRGGLAVAVVHPEEVFVDHVHAPPAGGVIH